MTHHSLKVQGLEFFKAKAHILTLGKGSYLPEMQQNGEMSLVQKRLFHIAIVFINSTIGSKPDYTLADRDIKNSM